MESVSMSFLILREDVTKPHHLTLEVSEHTFVTLHGTIREFTTIYLCCIIKNLDFY